MDFPEDFPEDARESRNESSKKICPVCRVECARSLGEIYHRDFSRSKGDPRPIATLYAIPMQARRWGPRSQQVSQSYR
jgi:hypothetical protein